MVYIITSKSSYGKSRAEIESNLRKDGLESMDDEQFSRCKYLEKKSKDELGGVAFVNQAMIKKADKITE